MNRRDIFALGTALLLGWGGYALAQTVNSSTQVSIGATKVTVNSPPNDVSQGPTNFTGAGTITVNSQGAGSVGVQVTGTFTGLSATFQATVDATNYFTISCFTTGSTGTIVTGITTSSAVGSWTCPAAGYQDVRVNVTAVSTGTATFTLNASAGSAQRPVGVQGSSANITGINSNAIGDPCFLQAKINVPIATSSGNTQLVAGVSAKKVYICSMHIVGNAAYVANVIEGTGAACTTANEAAIFGSTTAASGDSFPANGGMTYGNGAGAIGQTATAANGVCLLQSGTVAISGNMTYVQQ